MKKLVYAFVMMFVISFASCGQKTNSFGTATDSASVDSLADSTLVDSVNGDSAIVESPDSADACVD